jgi:O-antigen ligase
MIQVTWVAGVPRKVSSSPIIYDELFGLVLYSLPLVTITVVTTLLTKRDNWVKYIMYAFLITACLAALIIIVEFRRIGATIYTFRFSEPVIWWMKLKALAQVMALGVMIGYAYCLYARTWRLRIFFAALTGICLLGVYFSLENSWWLEVGAALMIMTVFFSRKFFLACCVAALPALPFIKAALAKLSSVKSADYYRFIIWQDMLRIWRMRPILGVGPGDLWNYDQHFTHLPRYLRDFSKTGLGVAHNGYLQVLGELGIVGEFFYLAFIVVFFYIAYQLFRRSNTLETRHDRILALIGIGLIVGSAFGDFTSGAFFLQPRQLGSANSLPQVLISWIVWGCVIYKDQVWRLAQRRQSHENKTSQVQSAVRSSLS